MRVFRAAIPRDLAVAACLAAVLASSCARAPLAFAPPPQRDAHFEASAIEAPFMDMNFGDAAEYIVKDIDLPASGSNWTHGAPELRFPVRATAGLDVVADIGMVAAVLNAVGPMTVSIEVNGHPVTSELCTRIGLYKLRHPVAPDWLNAQAYNRVTLRADKLYTSADGVKLGFVLYRAGFVARD
jgi:hypothetical protein